MAAINISDLNPVGSSFFSDSESYLNELTDTEVNMTKGGSTPLCIAAFSAGVAISIAYTRRRR